MQNLPTMRALCFPILALAISASHAEACEHERATSAFALACTSELIATAVAAPGERGEGFLVVLEVHRGDAAIGARIALAMDDPSLRPGERVLVFARRAEVGFVAAAGPRACLRGADAAQGPLLAIYASLPAAERTHFLERELLPRAGERLRADARFERERTSVRALEQPEPLASPRGSFVAALRARRAQ